MNEFIMMPIPANQFTAVCALLGGTALAAHTTGPGIDFTAKGTSGNVDAPSPTVIAETDTASTATAASPSDDGEIDAHGHPWSADLHASTKAKTGAGLWRMKPGASRPEPLPGFPKEDATGIASTSAEPKATNSATTETATAPAEVEDEDEFAAFRNALGDSKDPVVVPARKWTDADLGALSNQAAVKLGDPAPIKALVAQFVPEGVVAHSRNIPDDKRAEFAKAVEEKAGIEFAG